MSTYVVTNAATGDGGLGCQSFKTRPPADQLLDQRLREGAFARLVRCDGVDSKPVEVAHVRHGVMYVGLNPKIDWSETLQVVDMWEQAKKAIREQNDNEEIRLSTVVRKVIEEMTLPYEWEDRLEEVIRAEAESTHLGLV